VVALRALALVLIGLLLIAPPATALDSWTNGPGGGTCKAWDLDNGLVDPDGCIRGLIHDILPDLVGPLPA
jgi:hypothetical protein